MTELKITAANFENEVLRSDKPVLLDFYADWCGPCGMIAPIVEEIANEHSEIDVVKVNVDDAGIIAAMLGIVSIPTLILFKKGEEVGKLIGAVPKSDIEELIGR